MHKHLAIRIYGRVQGVLFRYSAEREAKKLKLVGFVRNEPDGSVYIEIEGEEASLKKFHKWCHEGPELAKVERVTEEWSDNLKNFNSFLRTP